MGLGGALSATVTVERWSAHPRAPQGTLLSLVVSGRVEEGYHALEAGDMQSQP